MKRALLALIDFYQKYLSPDHSWLKKYHPNGYCKYYPTCSEYSRLSIIKYGVLKGSAKSVWRILRCNPFSSGGVDEP